MTPTPLFTPIPIRLAWWLRVKCWKLSATCYPAVKRCGDIILSAAALLILSPLFLLVAIAIRLDSKGPVFFVQRRVGTFGREFPMLKFRSMCAGADRMRGFMRRHCNQSSDGVIFKMRNDPRVTRIGRILRKTSLDELPQLWNVLKGDMSLVGPRPPMPDEVREYTLEVRKRLDTRPGITCIWQISGRSELPFREQVRLDNEYIARQDLLFDLLLLAKTIPAVVRGKGAY